MLCNGGNRDGMSFSNSNTLEDCNASIALVEQREKRTEKESSIWPNCNDFSCETEVNDHLTRKSGDMDLDTVFNREPNAGEEIGTAPNAVTCQFFNQLRKLIMPHARKRWIAKKHIN